MCAQSLQSCLTLCNPIDCSPPGSSVYGILQARILELVDIPSSRGSSQLRNLTCISCLAGGFFTMSTTWKTLKRSRVLARTDSKSYREQARNKSIAVYLLLLSAAAAKSLQSCPTLCDPIDGSPPGSSVPGILQVRTLEWVAISFSNA